MAVINDTKGWGKTSGAKRGQRSTPVMSKPGTLTLRGLGIRAASGDYCKKIVGRNINLQIF
jgi:hypothetical protein